MRGRWATVPALLVLLAALTACAGPNRSTPGRCFPQTVSANVVRPGDEITVQSGAPGCAPVFQTAARRLDVVWLGGWGRPNRLATVTAYPSGAFQRQIRIPTTAATGTQTIAVEGVDATCPAGAPCPEDLLRVNVTVVDSNPDFGTASHPNAVASEIAESMQEALRTRPDFVDVAIVPDGIEAFVHISALTSTTHEVDRAFSAAQRAQPAADRLLAGQAHLHIQPETHSAAELAALTTRIDDDRTWRTKHRIALGGWGPDPVLDAVSVALRSYSDGAAQAIARRYGPAVIVSVRAVAPITL